MTNQPPEPIGARPSPIATAAAERDARALRRLRAGLDAGSAFLAFQPVVDAAAPSRVLFHEGLFRISDETGHEVPAADFMPAAEARDIGREVDRAALALAIRELVDYPELHLSINLSARSVGDPEWIRLLGSAVSRVPGLGRRLLIELTERSSPVLPSLVLDVMAEMRAVGVRIALDDFGTGHSSLAHLQDYRFDILKIDGRFIRDIERNADDRALLESMLTLARHFGMLAIVERVEAAGQADSIRALGADGMQGYLFGRPTANPAWRQEPARRAI